MKERYIKPMITVVEIAACFMQSTSCTIDSNSQGNFREDFVRRQRRRGVWGDLWANSIERIYI